jgi:3-deoxy-D-manno-octulosonic-acid transferase
LVNHPGGPPVTEGRPFFDDPALRLTHALATTLALPLFAGVVALVPHYRPLLRRMRPVVPPFDTCPIWVHACSVGEINTAKPLLRGLRERYPDIPIVLSTSTVSGMGMAKDLPHHIVPSWFPLDQPSVVRRFLNRLQPRALVILETELWPGVIAACARRGIPVLIANGRLSDKHMRDYRRFGRLFRWMAAQLSGVATQDERSTDRFAELLVSPERIVVAGNLKFDGAPTRPDDTARHETRALFNLPSDAPVVVFGSTRPGDETLAHAAWQTLRSRVPNLVFLVAPRHLDRIDEAIRAFNGVPVLRRSQNPDTEAIQETGMLVLDTIGELTRAYAAADVAVIGGSFHPGVEGHNPIEAAAQGVPVIFGPHMRNFREARSRTRRRGCGATLLD